MIASLAIARASTGDVVERLRVLARARCRSRMPLRWATLAFYSSRSSLPCAVKCNQAALFGSRCRFGFTRRRDLAQCGAQFVLGPLKIILCLDAHPERGRGAEISAEPQGGVSG